MLVRYIEADPCQQEDGHRESFHDTAASRESNTGMPSDSILTDLHRKAVTEIGAGRSRFEERPGKSSLRDGFSLSRVDECAADLTGLLPQAGGVQSRRWSSLRLRVRPELEDDE